MELTIRSRGGNDITLLVKYAVYGSYLPAFTQGDPDICREAEYPEVEINNLAELALKNGKWMAFDLSNLKKSEMAQVEKAINSDVMEPDDSPYDEPDYYENDCGY